MSENLDKLAVVVTGLTQVVKMTELLPPKFLPVVAVIVGAVGGVILNLQSPLFGLLNGLVVGLVSAGVVNRVDEYFKKD